jgi:hypothetical protein
MIRALPAFSKFGLFGMSIHTSWWLHFTVARVQIVLASARTGNDNNTSLVTTITPPDAFEGV